MPDSPLTHSLSPAERIALARAISAGQETAAKVSLEEGTEEQVSFDVHIEGWVECGRGTPEEKRPKQPDVDLLTAEFLLRVVSQLKVRPARFEKAVAAVAAQATKAEDLAEPDPTLGQLRTVLHDEGERTAARLPKVEHVKKATAGRVAARVTGRRIGDALQLAA